MSTINEALLRQLAHISQCIIPVIEGLLSEKDEKVVLDLVFILTTWHAYAKLRLHTDHTLTSFDALTKPLGAAIRHFAGKFSDRFDTKDLPKEAEARKRRADASKKSGKARKRKAPGDTKARFNLITYKLHALGDYVSTIRQRGTTDSYSTQLVRVSLICMPTRSCNFLKGECEHRRVKRFYARTNHRLIAKSISSQEARQRLIRRLKKTKKNVSYPTDEDMPDLSSTSGHIISKPWKESKVARSWMIDNESDPLFTVSTHTFPHLIVPNCTLGFCVEPQETRPVTAPGPRRRTYQRRYPGHRYRQGWQDLYPQDTAHQLHDVRPPETFGCDQSPHTTRYNGRISRRRSLPSLSIWPTHRHLHGSHSLQRHKENHRWIQTTGVSGPLGTLVRKRPHTRGRILSSSNPSTPIC